MQNMRTLFSNKDKVPSLFCTASRIACPELIVIQKSKHDIYCLFSHQIFNIQINSNCKQILVFRILNENQSITTFLNPLQVSGIF